VLIGRKAERSAIRELVDAARGGRGGALVIRGEPGVGKSALLRDAESQAEDLQVARAVGVEAESEIAFAAVDQALRPFRRLLPRLPPQLSDAIDGGEPFQVTTAKRFAVGLAMLELLADAAEEQAVLLLLGASECAAHLCAERRRPPAGVDMDDCVTAADADIAVAADQPAVGHRTGADSFGGQLELELILETQHREVFGFDGAAGIVRPVVQKAERAQQRGLRCLRPPERRGEVDSAARIGVDPRDPRACDVARRVSGHCG